jgi:protein tyrosine/serine phosphatase
LDRLTSAGIAAVRRYGIGAIVDLRSSWEFTGAPHPFGADPGYRNVPFIDAIRDRERDPASEHTRADLYRGSINRNGRCIAIAVRAIAEAAPGAVVVHCLAGADRTGLLVALLLDALGVDRSAIVQDYNRTDDDPTREPDTMQRTLDHIDNRWNGSRAYLSTHGLTQAEFSVLGNRLLEGRSKCAQPPDGPRIAR